MSAEYGRGPDTGEPRTQPTSGQSTAESPAVPPPRAEAPGTSAYYGTERPTGHRASGIRATATGFTYLAATLMVLGGLLSFFTGLEAVRRGSFYLVTNNYLYNINISNWGWIHIGIGAAVFLAGLALFARQTWARWVGVFLALVSAVMNFLFIPHYPLWAILVIALDIVIIWALTAGQRREAY